jgi:SHS2 domain-containing protein
VEALGQGEVFDPQRHPQGTEIKAITYSAMQIISEEADRIHMYFIVDI